MDEQMPLRVYKDLGGKDGTPARSGNLIHAGLWRRSEALRFSESISSTHASRVTCGLLTLRVQTQSSYTISALYGLFPPLCKTGISKYELVPKQSAAMGGAPTCRRSMHTQQREVSPWLPFGQQLPTQF